MLGPVIQKADSVGLQCALHAIRDAAIKNAIDALENFGTPGRRHRIEHLELASTEDAKRLGKAGITASSPYTRIQQSSEPGPSYWVKPGANGRLPIRTSWTEVPCLLLGLMRLPRRMHHCRLYTTQPPDGLL